MLGLEFEHKNRKKGACRVYQKKLIYKQFLIYYLAVEEKTLNEDESKKMVKILKALANPIRLKMIASLCEKPKNVYALAKELNLPYPLAYLHLGGLKKRGLVKEIRAEKRVEGLPTVKYYAPSDFEFVLTPKNIRDVFSEEKNRGEKHG